MTTTTITVPAAERDTWRWLSYVLLPTRRTFALMLHHASNQDALPVAQCETLRRIVARMGV